MTQADKHYHAVQFYKDESSLAGTVARFLADGISAGEPALVIATPSHTATVLGELAVCGLDVQELRRTGELQTLDARKMLSAFMVGTMPDSGLFQETVGDAIARLCRGRTPCPTRAYGEMVDLLWQEGNQDGAIRLELLWNQLASTHEFSLLCGYAFGHFYKETREDCRRQVVDEHSHVLPSP
jgi:hypothetical protein